MESIKIAVMADIHSNYIALKRCMNYALFRGVRNFLFLGDYVGDMAYPERTMQLLREYAEQYDCTFIRGNKETYWINYRKDGETGWQEYNSTTGVLWYAYRQMSAEDIDFFESLPIARKLQYGAFPTLIACHGSPENARESLALDSERAKTVLEQSKVDWILCAHTHRQGKTMHRGKVLLNPGSVGLSLGAGGMAQFMILHGQNGDWQEEFINLTYDTEEVVRQLAEVGLTKRAPGWCRVTAYSLRNVGRQDISHGEVLGRAMQLCRLESGKCNWPDIPEKYWDMALQEFFGEPDGEYGYLRHCGV